jgi:hypothetical protein
MRHRSVEDARRFVIESNLIEGIIRDPTDSEVAAHVALFLYADCMHLEVRHLHELQNVIAPGCPLRDRPGMNVRVGDYAAPSGGPAIPERLEQIIEAARTTDDPWRVHVNFEMLHPYLDGNGRTGRALWAWHTLRLGRDPFDIPFLHRFYYQTLEHQT